MGDRTWVRIELRVIDYEWLLRAAFEDDEDALKKTTWADIDNSPNSLDLVSLETDEVNYAEWDSLEELLKEHSIEYDKWWGQGGEYDAGKEYFRIVDGKMQSISIYEGDESFMEFLEKAKDLPPEEIKAMFLEAYENRMPFEIEPLI